MFCVIFKIMERVPVGKGRDPILEAIFNKDLLDKLRLMHAFKPHLKHYAELLIHKLGQHPVYCKILCNEMKYEVRTLVIRYCS